VSNVQLSKIWEKTFEYNVCGKMVCKSVNSLNIGKYTKERNVINVVIVRNVSLRNHALKDISEHKQQKSPMVVMNVGNQN
jgi:hypothetical protein